MKYMLMMNTRGGPYKIMEWPPKDIQAHIGFMKNLAKELTQAGELVTAAGQSRIAMSSTVNCVKLDGRSGLAR